MITRCVAAFRAKGAARANSSNQETGQCGTNGPTDVDTHGVKCDRWLECLARDELRHDRLPGRCHKGRAGADHKREHNQQNGRHLLLPHKQGEHGNYSEKPEVDRDQHTPFVQPVCQGTCQQSKQKKRQRRRRLHKCDNRRTGIQRRHQPACSDIVHPGADVRDQGGDPEQRKSTISKW